MGTDVIMGQPSSISNAAGSSQILLKSNYTIKIPRRISQDVSFISIYRNLSPLHPDEQVTPQDVKKALDSMRFFGISEVIGHEQTIESEVKAKSKKLKHASSWPFPLVDMTENGMGMELAQAIGKKPVLILNGHHKFAAMQKRGYSIIPALVHDYDTEIRIGAWYPVVAEGFTKETALAFGGIPCSFNEGNAMIASKSAYFMAVNGKGAYVFPAESPETDYIIDMQSRLLSAFSQDNVFYIPDYNCKFELGNGNTVLLRKPYGPHTVWEEALKGKLFPPKSTRHEFIRAKIDFPLEWLMLPLSEANARLQGLLSNVKAHFDELQISA